MTAIDDPAAPVARNPRREAQELVGDAFDARVLEPSPPAVVDGDLFADDPVALAGPAGRPVLAPVSSADLTWDQWLGERPERAPWAAARWLGAWRRLPPLPPAYADTRLALHRLVVYVASPARQRVNGKMALRWTFGGLGTPFFGDDEQVRVAGAGLVRQRGPAAEAAEITTLNAAAELVLDGPPDLAWAEKFDVPAAGDLDERLAVDPGAAAFLGDWFGFAWSVLEELRAEPADGPEPNAALAGALRRRLRLPAGGAPLHLRGVARRRRRPPAVPVCPAVAVRRGPPERVLELHQLPRRHPAVRPPRRRGGPASIGPAVPPPRQSPAPGGLTHAPAPADVRGPGRPDGRLRRPAGGRRPAGCAAQHDRQRRRRDGAGRRRRRPRRQGRPDAVPHVAVARRCGAGRRRHGPCGGLRPVAGADRGGDQVLPAGLGLAVLHRPGRSADRGHGGDGAGGGARQGRRGRRRGRRRRARRRPRQRGRRPRVARLPGGALRRRPHLERAARHRRPARRAVPDAVAAPGRRRRQAPPQRPAPAGPADASARLGVRGGRLPVPAVPRRLSPSPRHSLDQGSRKLG